MTRRNAIFAIAAAVAAITTALHAAGGGGGGGGGKAQTHAVNIRGGAFTPAAITIRAGDTVSWSNGDDRDHTVTAADGSFNSGNIRPGGSFSYRFSKPGRYPYSCALHPRMRGTVTVQ